MTDAPDLWRQTVADTFAQLVPAPLASAPPVGRVLSTPLGLARAFRVAGSPQILRRTTTSLRTAPADPLKICIQRAGRTVLHQGEVTLSLEPGELAVYDTGRPYALRLEGAWSCTVMTVPRDALPVPQRALAGAMRRSFGALSGPVPHPLRPDAGRLSENGVAPMSFGVAAGLSLRTHHDAR